MLRCTMSLCFRIRRSVVHTATAATCPGKWVIAGGGSGGGGGIRQSIGNIRQSSTSTSTSTSAPTSSSSSISTFSNNINSSSTNSSSIRSRGGGLTSKTREAAEVCREKGLLWAAAVLEPTHPSSFMLPQSEFSPSSSSSLSSSDSHYLLLDVDGSRRTSAAAAAEVSSRTEEEDHYYYYSRLLGGIQYYSTTCGNALTAQFVPHAVKQLESEALVVVASSSLSSPGSGSTSTSFNGHGPPSPLSSSTSSSPSSVTPSSSSYHDASVVYSMCCDVLLRRYVQSCVEERFGANKESWGAQGVDTVLKRLGFLSVCYANNNMYPKTKQVVQVAHPTTPNQGVSKPKPKPMHHQKTDANADAIKRGVEHEEEEGDRYHHHHDEHDEQEHHLNRSSSSYSFPNLHHIPFSGAIEPVPSPHRGNGAIDLSISLWDDQYRLVHSRLLTSRGGIHSAASRDKGSVATSSTAASARLAMQKEAAQAAVKSKLFFDLSCSSSHQSLQSKNVDSHGGKQSPTTRKKNRTVSSGWYLGPVHEILVEAVDGTKSQNVSGNYRVWANATTTGGASQAHDDDDAPSSGTDDAHDSKSSSASRGQRTSSRLPPVVFPWSVDQLAADAGRSIIQHMYSIGSLDPLLKTCDGDVFRDHRCVCLVAHNTSGTSSKFKKTAVPPSQRIVSEMMKKKKKSTETPEQQQKQSKQLFQRSSLWEDTRVPDWGLTPPALRRSSKVITPFSSSIAAAASAAGQSGQHTNKGVDNNNNKHYRSSTHQQHSPTGSDHPSNFYSDDSNNNLLLIETVSPPEIYPSLSVEKWEHQIGLPMLNGQPCVAMRLRFTQREHPAGPGGRMGVSASSSKVDVNNTQGEDLGSFNAADDDGITSFTGTFFFALL